MKWLIVEDMKGKLLKMRTALASKMQDIESSIFENT